MMEFIKNLPAPFLAASIVVIYILIGMLVSFVAGLFDGDSEYLFVIGAFWILALPLTALIGVVWLFTFPFKFGAKISKHKNWQ